MRSREFSNLVFWKLPLIEARKNFFQVFQFGQIVVDDVRIIGIVFEVVLMVALSAVESLEGLNSCDDGPRIHSGRIELRDVGLSDTLLLLAGVKDHGAVLGAGIRTLAVPLRGIVRNGEKNHQELAVSEF